MKRLMIAIVLVSIVSGLVFGQERIPVQLEVGPGSCCSGAGMELSVKQGRYPMVPALSRRFISQQGRKWRDG